MRKSTGKTALDRIIGLGCSKEKERRNNNISIGQLATCIIKKNKIREYKESSNALNSLKYFCFLNIEKLTSKLNSLKY